MSDQPAFDELVDSFEQNAVSDSYKAAVSVLANLPLLLSAAVEAGKAKKVMVPSYIDPNGIGTRDRVPVYRLIPQETP